MTSKYLERISQDITTLRESLEKHERIAEQLKNDCVFDCDEDGAQGQTCLAAINNSIKNLQVIVEDDADFAKILEGSLNQARSIAEVELNNDLFAILYWPTTLESYYQYLGQFPYQLPYQNDYAAWKSSGHNREMTDRTAQFYFLISQKVDGNEDPVKSNDLFSAWIEYYGEVISCYMNDIASFGVDQLRQFKAIPEYKLEESMIPSHGHMIPSNSTSTNHFNDKFVVDGMKPNAPSGWLTFNQFFARSFNPGERPVHDPLNNKFIGACADSFYKDSYKIKDNSEIDIRLKDMNTVTTVDDLLGFETGNIFANGKIGHHVIPNYAPHKLHSPVEGTILNSSIVDGKSWLSVDIKNNEFDIKDNLTDGYQFHQERGTLLIETNSSDSNIGKVAVVAVGLGYVSSVVLTAQEGEQVGKGEEIGYFQYGGSEYLIITQDRADAVFLDHGDDLIDSGATIGNAYIHEL